MIRGVDRWTRFIGGAAIFFLAIIAILAGLSFSRQVSDSPLIHRADLNQRITTCQRQASVPVSLAQAKQQTAIGTALTALADYGQYSPQFRQATDAINADSTELMKAGLIYAAAIQRSKDDPAAFAADC